MMGGWWVGGWMDRWRDERMYYGRKGNISTVQLLVDLFSSAHSSLENQ